MFVYYYNGILYVHLKVERRTYINWQLIEVFLGIWIATKYDSIEYIRDVRLRNVLAFSAEKFQIDKFPYVYLVLLTFGSVIEVFALFHKYFSQYLAIGYDQGRSRPEINPENLPILFDPELFAFERA